MDVFTILSSALAPSMTDMSLQKLMFSSATNSSGTSQTHPSAPAPGILEDSLPEEVGCLKGFEGQGKYMINTRGRSREEERHVGNQIEGNCFLSPFLI